jgi:hypothetical protein
MKGLSAFILAWSALFCAILFLAPAHCQAADCAPAIDVKPVSAGLSQIAISAPCLANGKVHFRYDSVELIRTLDAAGGLTLMFDCFLGDKPPLTIVFSDGSESVVQLRTVDLDRITKIAVIWRGDVNLDLHAYEYAAAASDEGHIWAGAPSDRWQVEERRMRDKRGHGFLSFMSDGSEEGDHMEVYTFVHEASQKTGAVTLALDYESRARPTKDADTCGTGLYADLEYKVAVWRPNGHVSRSRGSFAPMGCNQASDQTARYISKALPQLILTR